ncbi:hypothetical protein M758_3G073800 [Ceratodon purpureus]|nr:hypothetical protein M758_3G073800 [Ceratodon purpureus]
MMSVTEWAYLGTSASGIRGYSCHDEPRCLHDRLCQAACSDPSSFPRELQDGSRVFRRKALNAREPTVGDPGERWICSVDVQDDSIVRGWARKSGGHSLSLRKMTSLQHVGTGRHVRFNEIKVQTHAQRYWKTAVR